MSNLKDEHISSLIAGLEEANTEPGRLGSMFALAHVLRHRGSNGFKLTGNICAKLRSWNPQRNSRAQFCATKRAKTPAIPVNHEGYPSGRAAPLHAHAHAHARDAWTTMRRAPLPNVFSTCFWMCETLPRSRILLRLALPISAAHLLLFDHALIPPLKNRVCEQH